MYNHPHRKHMFGLSTRALGDALIVTALAVGAAWLGYRRRRRCWSRDSWISFGLTVLVGCALMGFALYFSAAVGQPWTGARGSGTRAAWSLVTLASLVGGTTLTTVCLMWFARGDPEKPFTPLRLARTVRALLRASPAERLPLLTRTPSEAAEPRGKDDS